MFASWLTSTSMDIVQWASDRALLSCSCFLFSSSSILLFCSHIAYFFYAQERISTQGWTQQSIAPAGLAQNQGEVCKRELPGLTVQCFPQWPHLGCTEWGDPADLCASSTHGQFPYCISWMTHLTSCWLYFRTKRWGTYAL